MTTTRVRRREFDALTKRTQKRLVAARDAERPTSEQRDELCDARTELRTALSGQTPDHWAALRLLNEVDDAIRHQDDRVRAEQLEGLVRVHEVIAGLGSCTTPEELIDAAPEAVCEAVGVSRAMISRVRGSMWVPQVLAIREEAQENADTFREYVSTAQIPLDHLLMETDLVRRRVPALVLDPPRDPRIWQEIVAVSGCTSYVVAPIMPTRRVIGFMHADRFGQAQEQVSAEDRDTLWAFTEHFGLLFERAVLVERLEEQRSKLRGALLEAAAEVDHLCTEEIQLIRRVGLPERSPATFRSRQASRVDRLLTAREQEVLELLAAGATNASIAQQLVVSEGTVKSHVKRIHRKLRVSNRAEAVARYLHLQRLDAPPAP